MNRGNRAWALVGLVVGLVLLVSCTPEFRRPELAAFQVGEGVCATDSGSVLVSVEPGRLVITGEYLVPTPCQALQPVLLVSGGGDLVLTITATPLEGVCVQCVGVIPYAGQIEGLSGRWRLRVVHGEAVVRDGWYDVPPP